MMRRKLSFINNECCKPMRMTESIVEADIQRQMRDRFDEECPYSLSRRSPKSRNCNSQVWQVAVNTVTKKSDALKHSMNSVFRSMNKLRTGFKMATQKLRPTTRRRFKLDESPLTPNTPKTRSKCLLGRTPTKMYSPFAIDTPPSLRRRFAYRRNQNLDSESNKSVNGKSESYSDNLINNENKQPNIKPKVPNENYGSLI
ncbi:uncharacterized protein LOC126894230 [Daktulosphaira vitifoliae]|uniref:uncharacterized protein LOC126894230 n=1 Tax=Daktulosphaira vitifoliae TaxID=58002 RepID=UPI0021AAAEEB|nr:uncharacterized protein LOC126894230 [Daktulosphaira vitifoliae]